MTDKKKLSLEDLIVPISRHEVPSSLGPLYIRKIVYGDLKKMAETEAFKKATDHDVGLKAIRVTTSILENPGEWVSLSDEVFSKLTPSDLDALASVAVREANFPATEDFIADLGRGVLEQFAEIEQSSNKMFEQLRNSFSFLKPNTLESLTASVTAIDQSNQKWKSLFSDIWKNSAATNAASAMEGLKPAYQEPLLQKEREFILPQLDFSNTNEARAAKAAEQAVDVLKQLAVHMAEVQAHTASMYSTLVLEAIPQWVSEQESNKKKSELSLISAAMSLRWTKWAVILSVFTSIGIAAYQQHNSSADADTNLQRANESRAYWEKQSTKQQQLLNMQIQETHNIQAELVLISSLLEKSTNPTHLKPEKTAQRNSKPKGQ